MAKSELNITVKAFADIFTKSGELRQSNSLINQIIEVVPSVVYVRDVQKQKNVFVNRSVSEALGYTPQEIISFGNKFAKAVMHPEDYARIPDREGKFENLNNGETIDFEYRMLQKSGEWRWFISRDSVFLRDDNGNPLLIIGTATDITEYKRIEEKLKESEDRFQLAFAAVQSLIYDWNITDDIIIRSAELKNLLGFDNNEPGVATNAWYRTRLHPEDAKRAVKVVKDAIESNAERFEDEYRLRHKNGHYVWVRDSGVLLRDKTGKAVRCVGSVRDINFRKQTEEALRESEKRLRLATETSNIGIWEWNVLTDEIRWDAQMFAIYGIEPTADGLVNYETWSEAVLPEDLPEQEAVLQETVKNLGNSRRAFRIRRHHDGKIRYIEAVETVRTNSKGKAEWVIGTNIDVTKRKEAEEELRQSQTYLARAQSVGQIGWWRMDVRRNELHWSEETYKLFGLQPGTPLTYESFAACVHPDDRADVDSRWQAALRGEPYDIEHRIVVREQIKWVREKAYLEFDQDGEMLGGFGITQDITERKRTEEQLRRNHETFFNLVKNTPFGIYIVDADFRLVEISEGSQKVFSGIEPLIGRDFAEILRIVWEEPFASETIEIFRRTLRTGEPYHAYSTTEQRGNKEDVESYDWKIERINLPDGRFGVVCYFYDLTFQKQIQEELRRSEERLKIGVEVAEFAICEIDYSTGINHLSKEAARLYGLGEEEMSIPLEMFHATFHPDDAPELAELIAESLKPDGTGWFAREHRIVHQNGDVRWLNVRKQIFFDRMVNPPRPTFGILAAQDITERKNQEAALSQSEERFRLASDAARALVYDADLTGKRGVIVHGLERVTGYTSDESNLSGEWWRSLIHPEDLPNHIKNYNEHLKMGGIYKAVYRVICKNGEYIWVEDTAQIVEDQAGNAVQLVGTIVDINERYKSEKALRESEEIFRVASEAATALVYDADLTGKRKTIAHGLERVTGYKEEEAKLTGEWFHSLIHPEDLPAHLENLARQLKAGENYKATHRLRRKGGAWIWVEDTGRIFRNENGEAIQMVGALIDISIRKQTEERLQEEKRFTQNIIEASPSLTYIYDITTQSNIFVSQLSSEILGYTPEEIKELGSDVLFLLLHPEDKEIARQRFEKLLEDDLDQTFDLEYRMRRKDRNYIWLYDRIRVFRRDSFGKPTQILGVASDITLRKAAEEKLRYQLQLTQNITDSAAVAIFVSNAKGETTFLNPEAEKIFGYTLKEIAGRKLHDVIHYKHPDGTPFPAEDCPLSKVIADGTTVRDYENIFYRKDGSEVYIVCSNMPIIENGKVIGEVRTILDISERKRREANLAFLADLQVEFAPMLSVAEITQKVGARLVEYLKLTHCLFIEIDETAETATVIHDEHTNDAQSLIGVYKIKNFHPLGERQKLAAGQTIVINDVQDDRDRKAAAGFESLGIRALITAPYIGQKGWAFALSVQCSQPHKWREDECELLQELAARVYLRIERARTEELLRESEERFRNMADHAPVMIWITEADGSCSYLSQSWYEFTGQTPETGLGFGWLEATHSDDKPKSEEIFLRANQSRAPFRLEYRLLHKDGQYRWAIDSAQPRFDTKGNFLGYIGSVIDITERKEQEERLRESEERFRSLFESIDEGFVIIEMIFDENNKPIDYRFEQANPAFLRLTGLPPEAIGKTACDLVPDLEEFWFETYGRVALTGEGIRFENEAVAMNRWFYVYASRVGGAESRRVAVVFNNITERKQQEEKIQKAEERLRLALDAGELGTWESNPNTREINWDAQTRELFGVSPDEPITYEETVWKIVPPEDQIIIRKAVEEALDPKGDGIYDMQHRVRLKDGSVRWLHNRGRVIFTGEGKNRRPVLMRGTVANITKYRNQEEKIRQSEERLRLATDAAEMFSWEVDSAADKIKWSDNAAKILGYNQQDLSDDASKAHFFIPPEESERISREFAETIAAGKNHFICEFRGYADRYWQSHNLIITDNDGKLLKVFGVTQDITARKRTEEKIQTANYRFRLAEEAAKGFNYDWNLETGKTTRSQSIEHILGYRREELDTNWRAWTDLIHPDDLQVKSEEEALSFMQNLEEDTFSGEYRVRHKNGNYVWVMERGLIVRDEEGKPCRVIGQTMDITEHKEQEELLRLSEERYRALVEASAQVVWTMDAEGKSDSHRHWFAQLTGKSIEEIKGKGYLEFIHPEDREKLQSVWRKIMKSPAPYDVEFRLASDGENYRYYNLRGVPLFRDDGILREWIGTVRDITERKLAEESLRESEEYRRLLIENARDYAIIGVSIEGIILSWNTGAELIFGYGEEEIIGQSADILFTPADRKLNAAQKEIETALKTGSASDERWHIRKDGSQFFASGVLHELRSDNGQLLGFVKIARDQTDKLVAEKVIRDHEMLKKVVGALEEERNRIARDLHDELGQQLTALRLKLEHCRKSFSDPAIGEQIDEIQSIAQNIDNGVDFIAWQFRPAALDDLGLYAALDKFVAEWSGYSGVRGELLPSSIKNMRFSSEIETNLYRIAQEALNNINKHAKAKNAELILEKRDNLIILIIADDGIGFSPKSKDILDKGIGLIGMQERATLIDGTLEIESAPDVGTTIYVCVPV